MEIDDPNILKTLVLLYFEREKVRMTMNIIN
jgi:hypothetical protein